MKVFLDTSVLVPVFYGDHDHHSASFALFSRCEPLGACCGAHSLYEVYATLRRMPGQYRSSIEEALLFVSSIRQHLKVIALDADEYQTALQTAAEAGVTGGSVYDALLASCAAKAEAELLVTWNLRHYRRLWSDIARRVRSPQDAELQQALI